jgi:hypothetical protein
MNRDQSDDLINMNRDQSDVVPAQAGIQCRSDSAQRRWIPAFAGMTSTTGRGILIR